MDSYLTFRLDSQVYGLPLDPIQQIIPMLTITPLPEAPDQVAGVINFHGQAVPIIDMRRYAGLTAAPYLLYTPIVLARIRGGLVGLVVDQVLDVVHLPAQDLLPAAGLLPAELSGSPVLRALARMGGRLALVLDPEQLFDAEVSQVLARAAELLPELAVAGRELAGEAVS